MCYVGTAGNGKLKYQAVLTLPVDLKETWKAKIGIAGLYVTWGNLLFLVLNLVGGYIIFAVYEIPLAVNVLQAVFGTLCIVIASLWEVPLSPMAFKKGWHLFDCCSECRSWQYLRDFCSDLEFVVFMSV